MALCTYNAFYYIMCYYITLYFLTSWTYHYPVVKICIFVQTALKLDEIDLSHLFAELLYFLVKIESKTIPFAWWFFNQCLRRYNIKVHLSSAESPFCHPSSRYPWYRRLPGPDFSTGNGCVPPEGGVQYQHDDHKFVQDNASGGVASLQRYATQSCAVHEPGHCQGLYHWGKEAGVLGPSLPLKYQ